jgi:rhodanese-related sulfurtransferase
MLIKRLSTLLTLALVSLFSFSVFATQTPKISQAELVELLSEQESKQKKTSEPEFIVLDVRTPKEFNNGHINNAINISHNTVTDNLRLLAEHKNKMIVVHCRSGRRAITAEKILKENGFTNVRHLEGDMLGWVKAKLPLVKE